MNKRNSIAKEIRDLGAGYSQILCDGWVHYLLQKDAEGGVVVADEVWLLQQVAGETHRLQYAQGKGCHHPDDPLFHAKAWK